MARKRFDKFGVMLDMSRNSVMKPEALKQYFRTLKKMGYNCVFLYTEDTYEVEGEPFFGYLRGRYTVEEMKEIDAYASSLGIEVIPCIQTLAHLSTFIRWHKVAEDTPDIIRVGCDRTYEFIDRAFKTLSECFKTRTLHVGMDEAHMLGRGLYMDVNGYEKSTVIIRKHLDRICEIGRKYGYNIMIWSDMFFRPWTENRYYTGKAEVPKEYIDALPKDVTPVFWDYYHTDIADYDAMMYNHRQLSKDFWFAGGAWTWAGYMPHNDFTLETMLPALEAAKKYRTRNVFFTMWGDDGGECSRYAVLPSLFYLSEVAKGNEDEQKIKEKFRRAFGVDYDDFMLLDQLDHICGGGEGAHEYCNPSKYALVSDTFLGWLDYTIEPDAAHRYGPLAEKLAAVAKKTRRFHHIFDTAAKLASAMEVKYDLGLRVRAAYKAGDKDALMKMAKEDYPTAIRRMDAFMKAVEKQWLSENKPFGLDVQHIRLGGVRTRLDFCRKTLLSYLAGEIDSIPELEETILPWWKEGKSYAWLKAMTDMTVGVI